METSAYLRSADHEARALLVAASSDWARPIPHCPGWEAAALVRHMGNILQWMAAVVMSGKQISRRAVDPPPEADVDLTDWYLATLARTLAVLSEAGPDTETWTFSSTGEQRAWWWYRRLAVETAIHRWDIEHATARNGQTPEALEGAVAAAGVEEFIVEFLPGLLGRGEVGGLVGTLHLHAIDGPMEWWIDLDKGGAARAEHRRADTAIRGTRSDLLLWLTNRGPLETLSVLGDTEVSGRWSQLQR